MLKYEDAIKYKVGDVVTINFTPTGKDYRGMTYENSYTKLKCEIIKLDLHDYERPLAFSPMTGIPFNGNYLPIEGVTIVDEFDMPEIEPGMWAKDRNGDNWLAVKTSKNSSKIEWIKAPIIFNVDAMEELLASDFFVDLHDADNVYWDRNKQTQLKELQQKQQELAKELEALNQQIQALK